MLKIAHCDDVKQDRNNILIALTQIENMWNDNFDIYSFESGEELCENLKENAYDVILLDIMMGGMDGIETANIIRSMDIDTFIIYISSCEKRPSELMGYNMLSFLDKPVNISKLQHQLKECYRLIKKDKDNIFTYTKNKVESFIYIKDIIYLESIGHKIEIHTKKETIVIYDSLKNCWVKLKDKEDFVMANRSYILNLNFVSFSSASTFTIDKINLTVSIGRTMKEDARERYMNFMRRHK